MPNYKKNTVKLLASACISFSLSVWLNPGKAADSSKETACYQHPIFIDQMDDKNGNELLKRFNEAHKDKGAIWVFQADINNDNKLENIFYLETNEIYVTPHDDIKSNNLSPFRPSDPYDDYVLYAGEPFRFEFLTKLCGKTYISFKADTYGYNKNRETYLWKDGANQPACDNDWTNYETTTFQTNYKKQIYYKAYKQLSYYVDRCNTKLPPQKVLWLQNDIALASYKAGIINACLSTIEGIEANPNFENASQTLKNSVAFNKKTCQVALATPPLLKKPLGSQAYAWLLDNNYNKLSESEKNDLFYKTIYEAAPVGKNLIDDPWYYGDEIAQRTCIPKITDGRYGITSSFYPHEGGERGLFWVDVQEGTSVLGKFTSETLEIVSKFYNSKTFPNHAKQDIKQHLAEVFVTETWKEDPTKISIKFYDMEKDQMEELSAAWLDAESK